MRLIDADMLKPDTEWSDVYDGFLSYSQCAIDSAPTISLVSNSIVESIGDITIGNKSNFERFQAMVNKELNAHA